MPSRELDPITRLTTDAVGSPGQRTFYLQAASGIEQVTLVVEKEQVRALAERLTSVLSELAAERPEDPDEVQAAEADDLQDPREVRLWVTRPQLRVLARHGTEVVGRGRPPCPLCGNPLDPTGHVCPAQNGHRPVLA